jgi:hypothetical protein
MPTTTVITSAVRDGNLVVVKGSTADTSDLRRVTVNGRPARSTRGSFAEWKIALDAPAGKPFEISATSEDVRGHVERSQHVVRLNVAETAR